MPFFAIMVILIQAFFALWVSRWVSQALITQGFIKYYSSLSLRDCTNYRGSFWKLSNKFTQRDGILCCDRNSSGGLIHVDMQWRASMTCLEGLSHGSLYLSGIPRLVLLKSVSGYWGNHQKKDSPKLGNSSTQFGLKAVFQLLSTLGPFSHRTPLTWTHSQSTRSLIHLLLM